MVAIAGGIEKELRHVFDPEISEVSLLLPRWQARALEAQAHGLGLTLAQFMRRILAEAVSSPTPRLQ